MLNNIDDYSNQPLVVVMTSDNYLLALQPFSYLLNRYWIPNPHVLVAGFSAPEFHLPHNFEFYSIGNQSDYPFKRWSNALHNLLVSDRMRDIETFVLMLEDYWLVRPVDTRAIHILDGYARQFEYVLKIDLARDRLYAHGADLEYSHVSYIDLVKSMPGSPYHMSLWIGLWRKDRMLEVLIPDESPHEVELIGTTRLSHIDTPFTPLVLGTRQSPVNMTLGFRGGNYSKVNIKGLPEEDLAEMRALGYFDGWNEEEERESYE